MKLHDLCWPREQLGQALAALTGRTSVALPPPASTEALDDWMIWAADRSEIEVTAADVRLRDIELFVSKSAPALYEIDGRYLAVIDSGKKLQVISPQLVRHKVESKMVAASIRSQFSCFNGHSYQIVLDSCGLSESKKTRLLNSLLNQQTGNQRFRRGWIFTGGEKEYRIWRPIPRLIATHLTQYLLLLASWAVLGSTSFSGHMDRAWAQAWGLLLLTLVPFGLLRTWIQGCFAINLGNWLKRRFLQGALRLEPEEVRTGGVGSFLGQTLEGEAVETLAISGGVTGLLALVEMIPAMFLLGRFALALVLWCVVAACVWWHFFRGYKNWTEKRMHITGELVESMVGHRTRLAQQPRTNWHEAEQTALNSYLDLSAKVDRTGAWLVAAIPRGWLLLGLLCIAPSLVAGRAFVSETAVLLGGVLLAFSAFQRLVASVADIAGAIVGWLRVKPLLEAANRRVPVVKLPPVLATTHSGDRLLEANRLVFSYPGKSDSALRECDLAVTRGDRILLEGGSGEGKTTLATVLCGLRKPQSGLLLLNGLDRYTLGDAVWRKQIVAVPQFHENYIVTETLAFNLLMGGQWPATDKALREAEEVCCDLGLADLLARMPSGIMQMVGEGGWQLSHGERSRIYLARALLQASAMVILDETFAALDPESFQIAMAATLRRAETLMVIAYP